MDLLRKKRVLFNGDVVCDRFCLYLGIAEEQSLLFERKTYDLFTEVA